MKRTPEVVIISDVHLGTYGCHAAELLNYLKSINPETLVLNGDIIDMWNFKKSYFPKEHLEVIRRIIKMSVNGTKVYYLTGNHDDQLRKFGEFSLGFINLCNKLVFQLHHKTHWVFHGDIFDASVHQARWLARLGGQGYDLLIRINRGINWTRKIFGFKPVSISAKVKKKVKGAVRYISDFEEIAIEVAAEKGYDYVICGHIHTPRIKEIVAKNGKKVTYLNSGDWVENLTALEYQNGKWSIYQYDASDYGMHNPKLHVKETKVFSINKEEFMPAEVSVAAFESVLKAV
jgi:UDP-2,3-diacylglucosamine pyrophosphatase LpxH